MIAKTLDTVLIGLLQMKRHVTKRHVTEGEEVTVKPWREDVWQEILNIVQRIYIFKLEDRLKLFNGWNELLWKDHTTPVN